MKEALKVAHEYTATGHLVQLPKEVWAVMMVRQQEQGNERNLKVFEDCLHQDLDGGGFKWSKTPEGKDFWTEVINHKNLKLFFDTFPHRLPVQSNVFALGDRVICIISGELGYVVRAHEEVIEVMWDSGAHAEFTLSGKRTVRSVKKSTPFGCPRGFGDSSRSDSEPITWSSSRDLNPSIAHYREGVDYSQYFKDLPERYNTVE